MLEQQWTNALFENVWCYIYVGMHDLLDKGVRPTSNQKLTNNVEPMSRMVNVICQRWVNKTENLTSTLAKRIIAIWYKRVKENI